jgi:hypothetical protein
MKTFVKSKTTRRMIGGLFFLLVAYRFDQSASVNPQSSPPAPAPSGGGEDTRRESPIKNPKSKIINHQSTINNQQSSINNHQSPNHK